jgi:hypothetical protein
VANLFLNAAAFPVVGEFELLLRADGSVCDHLDQAVFGVPGVVPSAVGEQVAVVVIGEWFWGFGNEDISGGVWGLA